MKQKFSIAMSLAVILAMLLTSIALADYVVNNIDNTIDGTVESKTITAGGSTSVGFYIQPNNSDPNDVNGCNATGSDEATVNLSVPANVTASATALTFSGCGVVQSVTFSSNTAGNYNIGIASVTGGKDGSAWSLGEASFTLIVNAPAGKQTPVITWTNPADIVYGTALSGTQLNATASVAGSFIYTPAAGTVLNAGLGQTLHVDFTPTDTTNYNNASANVTINVLKADPGCVVSGYTGVYDGAAHGATGSCTASGALDLGASFTNVPGGTANWTFTSSNSNYSDDSDSVAIVINKADATCSISGWTGTYDGAAHGATGSCTGVGGAQDELSGLDLGASFTNVPGGTANWTFTDVTGNYNDDFGSEAIVINKATLTVTADNQTIVFGQTLPNFTFKYSGFVNNETSAVIDTAPTCGVGSIPMFGSYDINCSGGSDNNYDFTYVKGTLTVQAWTYGGFYQPVDMDKLNIAKNGSTVPLKFKVFAGTTELTDVSSIKQTFVQKLTCGTSTATDDIEQYTSGGTSLRYDTTGGQFVFNWQTPKSPNACFRVILTLLDGTSISADFRLK